MHQEADAAAIAAELQRGYAAAGGSGAVDALAARLADEVEVWHDPPQKGDGMWPARQIEWARQIEVESFALAMPDYQETGRIEIDGDDILHEMIIRGTYKGSAVRLTLDCRWTVAGGRITRMGSIPNDTKPTIIEMYKANPAFAAFITEMRG